MYGVALNKYQLLKCLVGNHIAKVHLLYLQTNEASLEILAVALRSRKDIPGNSFSPAPPSRTTPILAHLTTPTSEDAVGGQYNVWPQFVSQNECFYPALLLLFFCLQVFKQSQEMILKWIVSGGSERYFYVLVQSIQWCSLAVAKSWTMHALSSPGTFHL